MASQKRLKKVLRQLMNHPDNAVCVDCHDKRPTWASILVPPPGAPFTEPIGCFVCYHCSGAHRRMGTHICFVRSTNLDEWKEKEVIAMKRGGNNLINSMFEANLRDQKNVKPDKNTELEPRSEFIYQKYQHRTWYDGSKAKVHGNGGSRNNNHAHNHRSSSSSNNNNNGANSQTKKTKGTAASQQQADPFANQENLFANAFSPVRTPATAHDPFANFGSVEFADFANFDNAFGANDDADGGTPKSPGIFGDFSAQNRNSLISSLESKEFKSNVLDDIAHLDIGPDPMSPSPKPKRISMKKMKKKTTMMTGRSRSRSKTTKRSLF